MTYLKKSILIVLISALAPSRVMSQERTIQSGDAIEVIVTGHEELSQVLIVDAKGMVSYPFLDGVPIDGLTLAKLREVLLVQLARHLDQRPLLTVRFAENYPINVAISGQVSKPGTYQIQNSATLQAAIMAAGGFSPGAQLSNLKVLRRGHTNGDAKVVNMETGNPADLPSLHDGDTIIVPGNPLATSVKVIGSVRAPGSYDLVFRTSLTDAIAMAGGPLDEADLKHIRIISMNGQGDREQVINFKSMLQSHNAKAIPLVSPGDVVYVPRSKRVLKKVFVTLRDLSTFATLYLLIRNSEN